MLQMTGPPRAAVHSKMPVSTDVDGTAAAGRAVNVKQLSRSV
jgi:hypothetical protein